MPVSLMTAKEVAEILRFSVRSINDPRFRRRIGLKAVKIGHSVRFTREDVVLVFQPRVLSGAEPHMSNISEGSA
jgi:hypothetical protein